MAERSELRVHVEGEPFVSYVGFVASQIADIYAVNAWLFHESAVMTDEQALLVLRQVSRDKALRDDISGLTYRLHAIMPTLSTQLWITGLRVVDSFEISMEGAGDAIDATAEVLDPLRRRQRKEQLRHDTAMHKRVEDSQRLDMELKSVQVVKAKIETINAMVESGLITRDEARSSLFRLVELQDQAADRLNSIGVLPIQPGPSNPEGGAA